MIESPITQSNIPLGLIDLGLGNPDLSLLPIDLIRNSAEIYFTAGDRRTLQYGTELGDGNFRRTLAGFLSAEFNEPVDPTHIFVTNGASCGLDLICSLFSAPGDTIFVEEPSYFLALRIFADHRLQVRSIKMDDDGINLQALENALRMNKPKFIYTIPTFQNPSGCTLATDRREKLVEIAERQNFLIVADEVYHFLNYKRRPPKAFAAYSKISDRVISINSFSKILAPGLRLGWIQADPAVINKLAGCGLLDSGGGLNPFTSAVLCNLVESGALLQNILKLRKEYRGRLAALDSALRMYLPAAEYLLPDGGFFFWVRLPGVDTAELRRSIRACNVDFRPGKLFSSSGGMGEYMRLGFCYYDGETIERGIRRLARCIDRSGMGDRLSLNNHS